MRAGYCSRWRLARRWLTAVVVGLLASFAAASAPHLVHHLGEHSKLADQCPVSILLHTLSGLLPPIPDLPPQLVIAWILIIEVLPLFRLIPALSYEPRAPPALASPLISR